MEGSSKEKTGGRYPIRVVARLTAIPIDTLRAWERRYGAVDPGRDERGRLYTDEDLRKLKLLRQLVDRGHAIGRIASLPEADLTALLAAGAEPAEAGGGTGGIDLSGVLAALERYDIAGAERQLARLAAVLSPREMVREVALPLMRQVGDAWDRGNLTVGQEHIASGLLRNLMGALVRLHAPRDGRPAVLLATPPGERHEFGILAAAMLAAAGGLGIVYLGTDLPAADILQTSRRAAVRAVILGLTGAGGEAGALAAAGAVARELPRGVELLVGGMQSPALAERVRATGATPVASFDELEDALRRLGARL
jgi:DNA-binding transcriptional MerR regulator/methylmalonyl-CoA mutase cobalamin-binding subunit